MSALVKRVAALALVAACSSDSANSPTTGAVTDWVVSTVVLPTDATLSSDLAFDLNGDGETDNALGAVLASLVTAGALDFQSAMDDAISAGNIVQLIRFQSDDPALTNDAAAAATWYIGEPTPIFTSGPHQIDASYAASAARGPLTNQAYRSSNPATTAAPASAHIALRLFGVGTTIYLPVNGVHVQWQFTGTTGIASGQIHGSIRQDDVTDVLIPAMAESFNAVIQAEPSGDAALALASIFDVGGCAGATADDGVIAVCEVATSSLIQSLLAPDVQIYNANGNYQPSAANTNPNALSFGMGFTAIAACRVIGPYCFVTANPTGPIVYR